MSKSRLASRLPRKTHAELDGNDFVVSVKHFLHGERMAKPLASLTWSRNANMDRVERDATAATSSWMLAGADSTQSAQAINQHARAGSNSGALVASDNTKREWSRCDHGEIDTSGTTHHLGAADPCYQQTQRHEHHHDILHSSTPNTTVGNGTIHAPTFNNCTFNMGNGCSVPVLWQDVDPSSSSTRWPPSDLANIQSGVSSWSSVIGCALAHAVFSLVLQYALPTLILPLHLPAWALQLPCVSETVSVLIEGFARWLLQVFRWGWGVGGWGVWCGCITAAVCRRVVRWQVKLNTGVGTPETKTGPSSFLDRRRPCSQQQYRQTTQQHRLTLPAIPPGPPRANNVQSERPPLSLGREERVTTKITITLIGIIIAGVPWGLLSKREIAAVTPSWLAFKLP